MKKHLYQRSKSSRGLTRRQMIWLTLSTLTAACTAKAPSITQSAGNSSPVSLEIWWTKGLVLAEDEAIQKIVKDWQKQSSIAVNLSFHKQDDILQKLERAYQAGNPPDILYAYKGDLALNPRFAWEGKLVDISDIVEPVKAAYIPTALEAVSFYNNVEKKRSYYAVPLSQEATYIFYLRDIVEKAGLSDGQSPAKGDRNIPTNWDEFWNFWQNLQKTLRPQNPDLYGLGIQTSPGNSDTYVFFEEVLQAYNVQLLDGQGKLQLDNSTVRQGIIRCLEWYTKFYKQGYAPPTATKWLTPDNNRALLNRSVAMTVNPSMSIPVSQRDNQELYFQQLGTMDFPNKPDGKPLEHLVSVNQVVILSSSQKQQAAKAFLSYLIQPQVLQNFVKSSWGRFFPVMPEAWQDSFWTNATDPHIPVLAKTLRDRPTRLFYSVQSPAYSQVFQQDVWGKVISQIATNALSVEQGGDEAIQKIREIFAGWH
ncbi:family 1 extracellular solute-binding protein [Calothrix sp. NIES-4101]|nr:family 1 extracellular solute-binding protein [Calothrix sp. NIES-4101]